MGPRHNCGIALISSPRQVPLYDMYKMLHFQQHRGQVSSGYTRMDQKCNYILKTNKEIGLVDKLFANKGLESGTTLIGHVRYSTTGDDLLDLAQPFERPHGRLRKWFAACFNGNITNFMDLEKRLRENEYHVINRSDNEVLMHCISRELRNDIGLDEMFSNLSQTLDGAYNIAFVDATGRAAVARDPYGFHPVVWGEKDGTVYAASESCALAACDVFDFQDLPPGHVLLVKDGEAEVKKFAESPRMSLCSFEFVYFAHVSSVIEGISVYNVRRRSGENLARLEFLKPDENTIIVPIPDSGITACDGMAYALGAPRYEGVVKNRYASRTFIETLDRWEKVRLKLIPIKEILKGKRVIGVDDSVVRGLTSRYAARVVLDIGGAEEFHMRSSFPPVRYPCVYGIDFSTVAELLAGPYGEYAELPQGIVDKLAEKIRADSLIYPSVDGLVESIGLPREKLCLACVNGHYPTNHGAELYNRALENYKNGNSKRPHEC